MTDKMTDITKTQPNSEILQSDDSSQTRRKPWHTPAVSVEGQVERTTMAGSGPGTIIVDEDF